MAKNIEVCILNTLRETNSKTPLRRLRQIREYPTPWVWVLHKPFNDTKTLDKIYNKHPLSVASIYYTYPTPSSPFTSGQLIQFVKKFNNSSVEFFRVVKVTWVPCTFHHENFTARDVIHSCNKLLKTSVILAVNY